VIDPPSFLNAKKKVYLYLFSGFPN